MLTRRSFLCSLAALSASRVAPVPVAAAAVPSVERLTFRGCPIVWDDELPPTRVFYRRRDDGDTILELR
jgi:hypothetical protein